MPARNSDTLQAIAQTSATQTTAFCAAALPTKPLWKLWTKLVPPDCWYDRPPARVSHLAPGTCPPRSGGNHDQVMTRRQSSAPRRGHGGVREGWTAGVMSGEGSGQQNFQATGPTLDQLIAIGRLGDPGELPKPV